MTIKSQKLFLLALMTMGGMTPKQCAEKLHLKVETVRVHMRSEMFRAQLAELRDQVQTDSLSTIMQRIDAEGMESLQTLVDVRDIDIDSTDPKKAGLLAQKRAAAQYLLGDLFVDRKVPKLGSHLPTDSGGLRLSISEDAMHQMFQALANFRGEDIAITTGANPVIETKVLEPPRKLGKVLRRPIKPVVVTDAEQLSKELAEDE